MRHLTLALLAFCGAALAQMPSQPGYAGPAILSRPVTPVAGSSDLVTLRPFVQVNGIYDTGLFLLGLNPNGTLPSSSAYGIEASFGAYGYHQWRHTVLGLDYRGVGRHYTTNSFYDGVDNFLNLQVSRQQTRHLQVAFQQQLASYSNSYYFPISSFGADPTFSNITSNSLFNNRTNVLMSQGSLVYQTSPRLSFGASGNGFVVKHRNDALIGVSGYGSGGNIAYRLTKFQTIGLDYNFYHYGFKHAYGNTDLHGLAVNYAIQLTRRWLFAARIGAYRMEAQTLAQAAVDPAIALIIGRSFAVTTSHSVTYLPLWGGNLSYHLRHSSLAFDYQRMIVPGNGVYLTSAGDSASANYSYQTSRRMSVGFSASYYKYAAVTQTLGKYRNYMAGIGTNYTLRKNVSLTTRFDARRYQIGGVNLNRVFYRAAVGITYSPGDLPFSLW